MQHLIRPSFGKNTYVTIIPFNAAAYETYRFVSIRAFLLQGSIIALIFVVSW